ncbi:FUSC family protein [Cellulomonas sp. HZM]|uniref:FUSC family protein n=1 Tax=Cellulomonas sp. HZM TaxID=1454010 RepID=UPI0012DF9D1C|nr:FUSC family protein [Cellulomonas sp. HZM]
MSDSTSSSAATPTAPPDAAGPLVPGGRLAAALGLLLAPALVVALSPWYPGAFLLVLGVAPGLLAWTRSTRDGVVASLVTGALVALGVVLSPWPLAGAATMLVVACAVAWAAHRGDPGAGPLAATQLALALVAPPALEHLPVTTSGVHDPVRFGVAGAAMALGGLWACGVASVLLGALPRPLRLAAPVDRRAAVLYGIALAPLSAVGTYVAMRWFPGTHVWWALLTLFVVVQPTYARARARAWARSAGTVVGAVVAAVLTFVVPSVQVLVVLGVLAGVVSVVANLTRPYAQYAAVLTISVILVTSASGDSATLGVERVALTLGASAMVMLVFVVGRAVLLRRPPAQADGRADEGAAVGPADAG